MISAARNTEPEKGRWSEIPFVVEQAPNRWKASCEVAINDPADLGFEALSASESIEVEADYRKQAWAHLLAKVYEIDLLVCPECGSEMKVIAIV